MPATAEIESTAMVKPVSNPTIHDAAGAVTDAANATSPMCFAGIVIFLCSCVN